MDGFVAQVDIEAEIMRLSGLLDQATRKILARTTRWARAESAYKRAFFASYLQVDGKNATEREARAHTAEVAGLYDDRKMAEAVMTSAQEAARNLRSQISALQTLAANQRFLLERG